MSDDIQPSVSELQELELIDDLAEALDVIYTQAARIQELEKALKTLRQWDMLTPGRLSDGEWARNLIDDVLTNKSQL